MNLSLPLFGQRTAAAVEDTPAIDALDHLDDRLLRDIGLGHVADARRSLPALPERYDTPFWRG